MAEIKGAKVYINLYDKWGNSVGAIELEPRLVDGLPKSGSRKGELVLNTQDSKLYFWDGSEWKKFAIDPHAHVREDITDFFASPFWDNIPDKPSTFPPEAHSHDAGDITSGTLTRPFKITSEDNFIDNYGLCIGGTSRRTSGEGLELYGPTSSAILSVQDGNGRIQLKWNATRGTNETFLVGDENAEMWIINPGSPTYGLFRIMYADGSGKNAGDPISWEDILQVGTYGMRVFKSGIYPASDNTLDLGSSSLRWRSIYVVNTYTGDVVFQNGWKITEFDENGKLMDGLRILDKNGEEIMRITPDGLYFKGKKIA